MDINKELKKRREQMKMTQKELAESIHKDATTISKLENGDGLHHQIKTIKDWAAALGCELKIDIIPQNLFVKDSTNDMLKYDLELDKNGEKIREEIKKSFEKIVSGNENLSLSDFYDMLHGPKFKKIVLTEIQNTIIDQLLMQNLADLSGKDAMVVYLADSDNADLLIDAVMSLSFEEQTFDDYGFITTVSYSSVVSGCIHNGNGICAFCFSESFIKTANKRSFLTKIKEDNNEKNKITEAYLEKNPNGFPFVCFLADRDNKTNDYTIMLDYEYDSPTPNLLYGKIIYAFTQEEAVNQFLNSLDSFEYENYIKNHLVEDIIEKVFFSELDYKLLDNGSAIQHELDVILKQIGTDDEEEYKNAASRLLTLDRLYTLLGPQNCRKVFVNENKYNVICFLESEAKQIYDFVN